MAMKQNDAKHEQGGQSSRVTGHESRFNHPARREK